MDKKKTYYDKDIEYTIVMDASYIGPDPEDLKKTEEEQTAEANQIAENEMLYFDYEKMALMLPTVLDVEDAYPRSYQWRVGDRYDEGKIAALQEALNNRTKIEDTTAYRKYVEEFKSRKFKPVSWD